MLAKNNNIHRGLKSIAMWGAYGIVLLLVANGCKDSAGTRDAVVSPVEFANSIYPDEDYLELTKEPWFVGVGLFKDVVTFREQGIITVAPSNSEAFVPRVYGVTDVSKTQNGDLMLKVIDFERNPKVGFGEFLISVGPIKDGECVIKFKNHSEKFQTAERNLRE